MVPLDAGVRQVISIEAVLSTLSRLHRMPPFSLLRVNAALLRRRGKFLLPLEADLAGPSVSNTSYGVSLQCNLESLGYALAPGALAVLCRQALSAEQLSRLASELDSILRTQLGAHRLFAPMYPDFPEQVIEANDLELFLNALLHYTGDWLGLRILPQYVKSRRKSLDLRIPPKLIDLAGLGEARLLLRGLVTGNVALSPADWQDADALLELLVHAGTADKDVDAIATSGIDQKENLAAFMACCRRHGVDTSPIEGLVKTATDVLRIAVAVSNGDVSLATASRFKANARKDRKWLLGMLERVETSSCEKQVLADMFLRRERFLRLGEQLHPGEYRNKFPRALRLFTALREGQKPENENRAVQDLIQAGDILGAVVRLSRRPGVLARSLANVLRKSDAGSRPSAVAGFARVADQVTTPVLLQVLNYFKHAPDRVSTRVFLPKALTGKMFTQENSELCNMELDSATRAAVISACETALIARFAGQGPLGKVYVDPALKTQFVPFAQRSSSKMLKTLVRGSSLALAAGEPVTRFFVWWSESGLDADGKPVETGRIDVDLSVVALDSDFNAVAHCSWTGLRSAGGALVHSGDITSAPSGACEFIDVHHDRLPAEWAYLALVVNSYTEQSFAEMPECNLGWMGRGDPDSGEIFEPRTVQNKIDLTAGAHAAVPALIDLRGRRLLWADLAVRHGRMVEAQSEILRYSAKGLTSLSKPTLFDLFELHARARGTLVATAAEADSLFSLNEGITPYAPEKIASEFLR